MTFARIHVWFVLAIGLLPPRTDGERLCSCYNFNNKSSGYAWPQANANCINHKKHLVVMETEQEWEFIKNVIQNREGNIYGEWFIGLEMNITTRNWTWVNGKSLTIDKWAKSNPDPNDFYGMIHKEFPTGIKGSFSTLRGTVQRGWICEKESDNCQGDCFVHPGPQSAIPPGTKAFTTKVRTSTEQDITDVSGSLTAVSILTTAKSTDRVKSTDTPTTADDKSSSSPTVMIVGASLGAVLFVAFIILIIVILLRRKKRQGKDTEGVLPKESSPNMSAPKNENNQLGESQYESVNQVEAAKLLGSPNSKSNTRLQPPPENCEYAVVNKANKKRKEADLVYAQLAEFDHETDFAKPPKPPSYEPTVYADVEEMPPELPGREDPDSSQPTYANLETTGV
ncbi:uncharacterized protein [Pocillopora verrucosa]|uniref:uncharacterized protein isoform X4 n=1 Tax=Pocillopora verrucosa TaxID=203993 RepID=UPI00333E58A9